MTEKTALLWFRQDLRLSDNPALLHALHAGYSIIPVYILDDDNANEWRMGGASRWWLHQSLSALNAALGGRMVFRAGRAEDIIAQLLDETGAQGVFWNRCYEPWRIKRDEAIKAGLKENGLACKTFNGSLLWEPWEVLKSDGTPYKVFTPYYRKGCLQTLPPAPLDAPSHMPFATHDAPCGSVDDLALMPRIQWYEGMEALWQVGENGAHARLQDFLERGLKGYKEDRNRPDRENVSRLSPHLHFGEISPRQVWHIAHGYAAVNGSPEKDLDCFASELGWREFSYYLLYHFPTITWENLQDKFDAFPWDEDGGEMLKHWQRGQTGIPIVDAGMRQLWQTGWMHNRVRMVVASFLVKNLLVHWRCGALWFWDTLVDADLASNSASWQWVAGSGADAAPYFRIFNPVTQGQKFDPDGDYIREFVPELRDVDTQYIHAPWESPVPPARYPAPIVDLKASRERALEALQSTKQSA